MAVIAITLAFALFLLPGAFRVQMVASIGVLTADTVGTAALIAGIACVIGAIVLTTPSIRQAIMRKQSAKQTALEAKLWGKLPSRNETNPDVLEPMLRRIAKRYPEARPLIEITLEQLESIRQSLAKIGDILQTNSGMLSHDSRYANNEWLIERVLQEISPGLVRIIYQAHEHDGNDTFVPDLKDVVIGVNRVNQVHVDETRELANGVVYASTQGDTDSILSQVRAATEKLTTTKKEEWL